MNRITSRLTPLAGILLAAILGAVEVVRGAPIPEAIAVVAIILIYALALVRLRGRSETASMLSGTPVDERWQAIHDRAIVVAGEITAAVLVVAFIVAKAVGADAWPYAWTAAVLGGSYLAAVAWFRVRS